jgi:hypothetical protein
MGQVLGQPFQYAFLVGRVHHDGTFFPECFQKSLSKLLTRVFILQAQILLALEVSILMHDVI